MKRILSMLMALAALLAAATFAQAAVGICPQSDAVGMSDIGDGCSLPHGSATAMPALGAFKDTFTQSCDWHDKCYTTLGTTSDQCDNNLLSNMRGACANNYPVYLVPDVYYSCLATAGVYYSAVALNTQVNHPLPYYQSDALARSRAMETQIRLDRCVPASLAATTLFDNSLLSQINSTWQTYAHRLPTLYEVFAVVDNGPDIVYYRGDWNSYLLTQAAAANGHTPPVVNAPIRSAGNVMTASPIAAGVTYLWGGTSGLANATSVGVPEYEPKYNTTYTASGYVSAVNNNGGVYFPTNALPTDTQLLSIQPWDRNAATYSFTYTEAGWCGPSPKQYCL